MKKLIIPIVLISLSSCVCVINRDHGCKLSVLGFTESQTDKMPELSNEQGSVTTKLVDGITAIDAHIPVNIIYSKSPDKSITIEGDKALIAVTTTAVDLSGVLHIQLKPEYQSIPYKKANKLLQIRINYPTMGNIYLSGATVLYCNGAFMSKEPITISVSGVSSLRNLNLNTLQGLTANISGASSIKGMTAMAGGEISTIVSGASSLSGLQLTANAIDFHLSGSSVVYSNIDCKNTTMASLSGACVLHLSGKTALLQSQNTGVSHLDVSKLLQTSTVVSQ